MKCMRRAFTLMEVNLAIFIMAVGVLGMVSLYSLGFRESRQSEEDVAASGIADAFLAPLVAKLSDTNLTWDAWCNAVPAVSGRDGGKRNACNGVNPQNGWADYADGIRRDDNHDGEDDYNHEGYVIKSGCNSTADGVADRILNANAPGSGYSGLTRPSISKYSYGLVATRRGSTISLAFRASHQRQALLSQPVFYTEVHFQGRTDQ